MQVAMTLLTHCGKALLALDDMEQVVHYLKAEVAFCTAHISTIPTFIHDGCHFVHAVSEEVKMRGRHTLAGTPGFGWHGSKSDSCMTCGQLLSLMANSLSACCGVESVR